MIEKVFVYRDCLYFEATGFWLFHEIFGTFSFRKTQITILKIFRNLFRNFCQIATFIWSYQSCIGVRRCRFSFLTINWMILTFPSSLECSAHAQTVPREPLYQHRCSLTVLFKCTSFRSKHHEIILCWAVLLLLQVKGVRSSLALAIPWHFRTQCSEHAQCSWSPWCWCSCIQV